MLKKIFVLSALSLALVACSKNQNTADKTPDTTVASAPASAVAVTPTPTVAPQTDVANSVVASSAIPTTTEPTPITDNNATSQAPAPVANVKPIAKQDKAPKTVNESATPTANTPEKAVNQPSEKPAENAPLKADLVALFKTINDIDKKHLAKQAELEQKMQSATTPDEQKKVFDEIVKQLDNQKATLNTLKFNDKRVSQVRDNMLKNIDETRKGMAIMAKNPEATPQSHPEIAKTMQQADKTASQVRDSIQSLVKETGIDPNQPE